MSKNSQVPLLIVGYKRLEGIREIIEIALRLDVGPIFVSVDGVRLGDLQGKNIHSQIIDLLDAYSESHPGKFVILNRDINRGCSAAVLSSIDWFFSQVDKGVILEDDCLPTEDFFKFSIYSFEIMESNSAVWLSCGSQFVPSSITRNTPSLSVYPFIWGWATTRSKWLEIRSNLQEDLRFPKLENLKKGVEGLYWLSGSRRARDGYVDAWDTPLVATMWGQNKLSLLPGNNLVRNRGIDEHAIHTSNPSPWINFPTGNFMETSEVPKISIEIDGWLSANFYKISKSHPLRNLARFSFDKLRRPTLSPLLERWDNANLDWLTLR